MRTKLNNQVVGRVKRTKLNNQVVVKLESPTGAYKSSDKPIPYEITWDSDLAGFGALVTRSGAKSFVFNYRNRSGTERRIKIGDFPTWAVSVARDEAKGLRKRVDRGEDPKAEERAERQAPTVRDLCAMYEEEHLPRKRASSAAEDRRQIQKYIVPKLGRKKVADVTRRDIKTLHKSLESMPYRANRLLALLSKMFNLAITEWELRADNPCKGVDRFPEQGRERFLSQQEIANLSDALAEHPNQTVAAAIRFLLLTGARKGEVINATWDQFDFERGLWDKPSSHTKTKRRHVLPLSAPALQILADLPRDSERVFPGLGSLGHAWQKIRGAAGLDGVRIHDLRHSAASILASKGLSLPLIGAVLGHTQWQTTMRYSHLANHALQEAVDLIGDEVAPKKSDAEVLPMRRGG
jgi:integrase